ncbi:general odorant-binding protein 57c-like [Drosophila miranda]|uniref:general odorant-binding protein 57c-like n=1 Tax=Drosophila miranda TaxID=7229 RepID=UPI00143FABE9|nr:general odorant-binding protein 57c-like [Drosophila miranda]
MLHVSIVISLLLVALTESLPTALDESDLMNECLYFSHITQEKLQAQMNISSSEKDLEDLDRKYKCLAHCLVARANLLDSRGRVDVAKIDELEPLTDEHRQALETAKERTMMSPITANMPSVCSSAYRITWRQVMR